MLGGSPKNFACPNGNTWPVESMSPQPSSAQVGATPTIGSPQRLTGEAGRESSGAEREHSAVRADEQVPARDGSSAHDRRLGAVSIV